MPVEFQYSLNIHFLTDMSVAYLSDSTRCHQKIHVVSTRSLWFALCRSLDACQQYTGVEMFVASFEDFAFVNPNY